MIKKITWLIILVLVLIFWLTGTIPRGIATLEGSIYIMVKEEGEIHYEKTIYHPGLDSYLVYFEVGGEARHVGIQSKYFPFNIYYDSNEPG